MLKAEIKKEIMIRNKEIAHFLVKDGALLDRMSEILEDMLYDEYKMDYDTRCRAVAELTDADYTEILIFLAHELSEKM